jgi:hypothetical protein
MQYIFNNGQHYNHRDAIHTHTLFQCLKTLIMQYVSVIVTESKDKLAGPPGENGGG